MKKILELIEFNLKLQHFIIKRGRIGVQKIQETYGLDIFTIHKILIAVSLRQVKISITITITYIYFNKIRIKRIRNFGLLKM